MNICHRQAKQAVSIILIVLVFYGFLWRFSYTPQKVTKDIPVPLREAWSFQDEGTREKRETSKIKNIDDDFAPSGYGTTKNNDYYLNDESESYFDALTVYFDVGRYNDKDYTPYLNLTIRVGDSREGLHHYAVIQTYDEYDSRSGYYYSTDYSDIDDPTKKPYCIPFSADGEWTNVTEEIRHEIFEKEEFWITIRFWNAQVDKVCLSLRFIEKVESPTISELFDGTIKLGLLLVLTLFLLIWFFSEGASKNVERGFWDMIKEVANPVLGFIAGCVGTGAFFYTFAHTLLKIWNVENIVSSPPLPLLKERILASDYYAVILTGIFLNFLFAAYLSWRIYENRKC